MSDIDLDEAFEHYCSRSAPHDATRIMFEAMYREFVAQREAIEMLRVFKRGPGRPKGSRNKPKDAQASA